MVAMLLFDKGYYHVEVFLMLYKSLGLSLGLDGVDCYHIFAILPFGLTTAYCIFTILNEDHWSRDAEVMM